MTSYRRITFLVPIEHEEIFTAELWSAGILGCEVHAAGERVRLDVYFPDPDRLPEWDRDAWRARGVEVVEEVAFEERDWLEEYRAAAGPIEVGRGFLVDPRDADDPSPLADGGGRVVLRIPARTAFGTGSHESTRLAVEWLEALEPGGLDVLDVGTGSGILAFVALRLGARRAVGFDVDPAAALIASQNAGLNRCRPEFFAGRLAALRGVAAFDLALVNVLPERILAEVPRLLPLLGPGGRVISSGNLLNRREELVERFKSCGLAVAGEKHEGEWVAFLLRRSQVEL